MSNRPLLRALVDCRNQQIQKARKAWENRKGALERGQDDPSSSEQYKLTCEWFEKLEALEKQIDAQIAEVIRNFPIYEHVTAVKGIGPSMAAQLAAFIDVAKAPYPSSLWKYAGLGLGDYWADQSGNIVAPKRGRKWDSDKEEPVWVEAEPRPGWELVRVTDRLIAGWLAPYNKRLKTTCLGKVGSQLMRAGGDYRDEYDLARDHYAANRDWSKGHCHYAAVRKMVKLFLSHYWERARELRGLEVATSYAEGQLDHKHITEPEDYGWPPLS
jgi:hypothetical protein